MNITIDLTHIGKINEKGVKNPFMLASQKESMQIY